MAVSLDAAWTVVEVDARPVDRSAPVHPGGPAHRICFWCKGLTITARIHVTQFGDEPNTTWHVGFVQVLRYSKMKAHYGNGILEWTQRTLPCYDSTNRAIIPWYTVDTHREITIAGQRFTLILRDYPISNLDPTYDNPGNTNHGNRLTHYIKHNKFDTYIILRKTVNGRPTDTTMLRHLAWTTKVELQAEHDRWTQDPGSMYRPDGYRIISHELTKSRIHAVITAPIFSRLPPEGNLSANDHIDEAKRNAHHSRYWPFHH